jgi:16S rRNA (uracil1498-N3)-methyltransferase
MRRFFINEEDLKQQEVTLDGDEFHHLKNVSRLEAGEFVELLDGQGHIARAKIISLDKKSAQLRIDKLETLPPPPSPLIEIILCVPRFQKMDLIIQKAVELNAYKITVVTSDRSFMKTVSKDLLGKLPRWKKIAAEACKQSGRAWPLQWGDIAPLESVIEKSTPAHSLFLYEGDSTTDIKSALQSLDPALKQITVFVGAEGGFSPEEVKQFEELGLRSVTLGPLVLRVETACITILSVIEYHFGHLR